MTRTIADPYLAQNAGRKYPLADDVDSPVPDNAILDFRCAVFGVMPGDVPEARLTSITASADGSVVTVSVVSAGSDPASLAFRIPATAARSAYYTATASGTMAFGALTVAPSVIRSLSLSGAAFRFSRGTVVADALKVFSIQSSSCSSSRPGDPDLEAVLSGGAVILDSGFNTDPYIDGNRVGLDIYKGAGIGEWCQYETPDQTCDNVMFSINGERPGSDGDIRIVGEDGVTVTPVPGEHAVEIRLDSVASDTMTSGCEVEC